MFIMNNKHKAAKAKIDLNTERTKYDQYKKELLERDFSYINKWMNGKSIDAFTSASIPKSTSAKIKDFIDDGIKNVLLSTIGLSFNREQTDCFWVLSGNDLHFLNTDMNGELDGHIVFDSFRIEKAALAYGGTLKPQVGLYSKDSKEYLPKTYIITFDFGDFLLPMEIHDRLNYTVNSSNILNLENQLKSRLKYQVVGEKFISILQNNYPNLKMN